MLWFAVNLVLDCALDLYALGFLGFVLFIRNQVTDKLLAIRTVGLGGSEEGLNDSAEVWVLPLVLGFKVVDVLVETILVELSVRLVNILDAVSGSEGQDAQAESV